MNGKTLSPASPGPRRLTGPLLGLLAPALALLVLGCSQHEYSVDGPVPPAPKDPRSAHVVKKSEGGMNSVAGPEEEEMPAQQAQASASPSQGNVLRGTITLPAPLASKFHAGETLYVIVRDAQGDPTPVAAQKLTVQAFPVTFEVTDKDAMMGGALPPKAEILIRLDSDGDLSTRGPDDLIGGPAPAESGRPVTIPLQVPPK